MPLEDFGLNTICISINERAVWVNPGYCKYDEPLNEGEPVKSDSK